MQHVMQKCSSMLQKTHPQPNTQITRDTQRRENWELSDYYSCNIKMWKYTAKKCIPDQGHTNHWGHTNKRKLGTQ